MKKKVIQTLYSGLGGHSNVVFSLLNSDFLNEYRNVLVFFGVESVLSNYLEKTNELNIKDYSIQKKRKRYQASFRAFKNILKIEQPNVIIIHNSELILTAVKHKKDNPFCKIIYVEHEPNHSKTRLENFLSKFAAKSADIVVCLNKAYKQELINKHNFKARLEVISNGLNTKTYKRNSVSGKVEIIGMAARLVDTKDHKILIEAFYFLLKDIPSLKLKIAGTGNLMNKLSDQVRSLKIEDSVEFLGLLDEDEMLNFYNNIDLYVHATRSETLSTSILQAMSCQHLVITSNINNNLQLIDNGVDGILYENDNSKDLYLKIKDAIDNFDKLKYLGLAARKKVVNKYSNHLMSNNYIKVIEE